MDCGCELRNEGTKKDIFDLREAEVKSGKLFMPKGPSTLPIYGASDEDYNRETGECERQVALRDLHSFCHTGEHRSAVESGNSRRSVDHGFRHPSRAHHAEPNDVAGGWSHRTLLDPRRSASSPAMMSSACTCAPESFLTECFSRNRQKVVLGILKISEARQSASSLDRYSKTAARFVPVHFRGALPGITDILRSSSNARTMSIRLTLPPGREAM